MKELEYSKTAEEITRKLAESVVRVQYSRADLECYEGIPSEDDMVVDAQLVSMGDDPGCLGEEEMTAEYIDVLFVEQKLREYAGDVTKLRGLASACYQMCGVLVADGAPIPTKWLDALSAAAQGEPFDDEGLLPFEGWPMLHAGGRSNRGANEGEPTKPMADPKPPVGQQDEPDKLATNQKDFSWCRNCFYPYTAHLWKLPGRHCDNYESSSKDKPVASPVTLSGETVRVTDKQLADMRRQYHGEWIQAVLDELHERRLADEAHEHQWHDTTSDIVQRCAVCLTTRYVPSPSVAVTLSEGQDTPISEVVHRAEENVKAQPDVPTPEDAPIVSEAIHGSTVVTNPSGTPPTERLLNGESAAYAGKRSEIISEGQDTQDKKW